MLWQSCRRADSWCQPYRRSRRAKHSGTQTMPQCLSWARFDACGTSLGKGIIPVILFFGKLWHPNLDEYVAHIMCRSKLWKVIGTFDLNAYSVLSELVSTDKCNSVTVQVPSSKTLQPIRSNPLKNHCTPCWLSTHMEYEWFHFQDKSWCHQNCAQCTNTGLARKGRNMRRIHNDFKAKTLKLGEAQGALFSHQVTCFQT